MWRCVMTKEETLLKKHDLCFDYSSDTGHFLDKDRWY